MKTTILANKSRASKKIEPFSVTQAVVGIELGATDEQVLSYFNFFSSKIPVTAAYFVHVLPSPEIFNINEVYDSGIVVAMGDELNDGVTKEMERVVKQFYKAGENSYVEYDVRTGDPLEEILSDTEELKADLVVVGQKKGGGWHGILARNLARKVKGNALIIPPEAKPSIQNILVPVDFSPNSVRALQAALALRKQIKGSAKVICLHAYELPNFNYYSIGKTIGQMKLLIEDNIQEAMGAFLHTYAGEDRKYIQTLLVEKEDPGIADLILQYAGQNKADFLVMGAKGHSKVELLLMGSVTERLLDANSRLPVLVVK